MIVQIQLTEVLHTIGVIGVLITDVIINIIRDVETQLNISQIIYIFHQLSEVSESEGGVCGS